MTDAERAAVLEAWALENARPYPKDWSAPARIVAFVLLLVAFKSSALAGLLHLPKLAVMLPLLATSGIALVISMTNFAESAARERAEAAIEKLGSQFVNMSEDEKLSAAVSLIVNAFFSGGPYTRETIDIKQVRGRLGASLPYVEAIEEVLVSGKKAYRVVSSDTAKKAASQRLP